MNTKTMVLIATTIAFASIIAFTAGVVAVYTTRYSRIFDAARFAVDNELFCDPQAGECLLSSDDSLGFPAVGGDTFDYAVARYCADLVARVQLLFYKKNGHDELRLPADLALATTLTYDEKIIGYVASSSDGTAWVVYRGTAHELEWRQDFNFHQTELLVGNDGDDEQEPFATGAGDPLSCHSGFVNVFNQSSDLLLSTIEALAPTKVVVTGHSLGASVATLAMLRLAPNYRVHTYVFGSPRVCNRVPVPSGSSYWRINNTTDAITTVPLSVMPNVVDKTKPFLYTHGGVAINFTDNRESLTNNHLMPVYVNELDRVLAAS